MRVLRRAGGRTDTRVNRYGEHSRLKGRRGWGVVRAPRYCTTFGAHAHHRRRRRRNTHTKHTRAHRHRTHSAHGRRGNHGRHTERVRGQLLLPDQWRPLRAAAPPRPPSNRGIICRLRVTISVIVTAAVVDIGRRRGAYRVRARGGEEANAEFGLARAHPHKCARPFSCSRLRLR